MDVEGLTGGECACLWEDARIYHLRRVSTFAEAPKGHA